MKNPPAFDQILIDNYETLEKVVTERKWLPAPITVATEAAKQLERTQRSIDSLSADKSDKYGFVTTAMEAEIKRLLKKKKHRIGFAEYGAGHYGAVYPTQMPGIVCKITTDKSEAQFVANAISIGNWPEGIVKYYAIFQFKDKKYKRRPVYILWRDEVDPPQLTHAKDDQDRKMITMVHNVKDIAAWMRGMLLKGKREIPEDYPDYMQFDINDFARPSRALMWTCDFRRVSRPYKLAAGMEALRWGMRDQMDWSYAFNPGGAMWFYLENGMLLADVHSNNIMMGKDGWVISDPGHMIELDNRYSNVHVPQI